MILKRALIPARQAVDAPWRVTQADVNIAHPNDTADVEQESSDFRAGQDYMHLTATLAPRPAPLIFNAEDNCCFRAPMDKEGVYDSIKAFYAFYGKTESLAWHENLDPGAHNYELDNREQSYRFLAKHSGLSTLDREIPADNEVRSEEELAVRLPKDNLTILELACRFAANIHRDTLLPQDAQTRLQSIVRYKPASLERAWMVDGSKNKGVESRSYQLLFNNGLTAAAVWFKSMTAPDNARRARRPQGSRPLVREASSHPWLAGAITPSLFSKTGSRKGMPSLVVIFNSPIKFRDASPCSARISTRSSISIPSRRSALSALFSKRRIRRLPRHRLLLQKLYSLQHLLRQVGFAELSIRET